MSEPLGLHDCLQLVAALKERFEAERDRLNELDAVLGDGDHGLSMARGFAALHGFVADTPPADISALLSDGGMRFNEAAGSTIGVLVFAAARAAGHAAQGKETLEAEDLAVMLEAAIAAIRKRGKAEPGHKTVLDSIQPALEALRAGLDDGLASAELAELVSRAAAEGAERTRDMESRIGRARWFKERSRGALDPGAVSGQIIIAAVAQRLGRG